VLAPVATRSGGTPATPMIRASEVAPTAISSSQLISRSTGSISAWAYRVTAVTWPSVARPWLYIQPPASTLAATGITYAISTEGNQTMRSLRV
jgi:hypothetical protein